MSATKASASSDATARPIAAASTFRTPAMRTSPGIAGDATSGATPAMAVPNPLASPEKPAASMRRAMSGIVSDMPTPTSEIARIAISSAARSPFMADARGGSELLAEPLAPDLVIEGRRQFVSHAGFEALLEFFQHDAGYVRQVEVLRVFQRQPDEFHQFRIRPDHTIYAMRDPSGVDAEETRVEPLGPLWRRNGAGNETKPRELRQDSVRVERAPVA